MKKKNIITALAGGLAAIIGLIIASIGYRNNIDEEITKEDTLVFIGFFFVIIGIVLLVSGLIRLFSKKTVKNYSNAERVKRLSFAALFAALAYIGFQYFRFDLTVVLAALFLGGLWGGMAGAIGLTVADFTSGYVTSAPKTFFLKLCIGLIVGLAAHTFAHLSRAHSAKKIMRITLISSICGMAFNIVADPITGYFYKKYLFGIPQDIASALAKLSSLTTAVNAVLSVTFSVILYTALRPALEKSGLFFRLESENNKSENGVS